MKNVLITTNYNMGIGDLTSRLYSIVDLALYIKTHINDINNISIVIEVEDKELFENILNVNDFKNICNNLLIEIKLNIPFYLGKYNVTYNNIMYYRQFSAINNHNVKTDAIGFWDFYTDKEHDDYNIPAQNFEYRDPSTRKSEPIHDNGLLIFNTKFYQRAEKFVENNLNKNFEVIYYRACNLDKDHAHRFVEELKQSIPIDTRYYICSDSVYVADLIKSNFNNSVTIKDKLTNGVGCAAHDRDIIDDLITEMIICSLSNKIHYAGKQVYISLFVFFAHIVKRVPLIYYQ